jgi:hypothetical protein
MNPDRLIVLRDLERPPEAWRYTVPETGVTITADFYHLLYPLVVAHCRANSVPMGDDFDQIVEDGACRETTGAKCGKPKPKPVAGMPLALLDTAERFIKSVWHALRDRQFVTREEAERRMAICLQCPLRTTRPGGCESCFSILKKAVKLMEDKNPIKIEPDEDGTVRDTCGACQCLVLVKSLLPNSTLDKAEGDRRPPYWEKCWRNGG